MYYPAKILNGASLSAEVDLRGGTIVGIQMPAAWTAANITFQGACRTSLEVTPVFQDVYDDGGTEVVVTAAAARFINIVAPFDGTSLRYIKVRSGTSAAAVAQGADRDLIIVVRYL